MDVARRPGAPGARAAPVNQYNVGMPQIKNIIVIGAGNIGGALIGGMLSSGMTDTEHLRAAESSSARAEEIREKYSIDVVTGEYTEAVGDAEVVILAVKPTTLPFVLKEIRDVLREDQILISVAAAFPIALIERRHRCHVGLQEIILMLRLVILRV